MPLFRKQFGSPALFGTMVLDEAFILKDYLVIAFAEEVPFLRFLEFDTVLYIQHYQGRFPLARFKLVVFYMCVRIFHYPI